MFTFLDLERYYKDQHWNLSDPIVARLASWSALEALSPQTYRKPEDLSSGRNGVAELNEGMPWTRNERPPKNYKLYYEIILGAIDLDMADERMTSVFGKDEEKQRRTNSKAVIASILVDEDGIPVADAAIVSSFAWALPLALEGKLSALSNWSEIEEKLKEHLLNSISRQDKDGKELALDMTIIIQAYQWLLAQLRIPDELTCPPSFAIRQHHYSRSQETPECSFLNSFFIEDLSLAIKHYQEKTIGDGLKKYLGLNQPRRTYDLLRDENVLEESLSPKNMPAGRWPIGRDRALVLLQQSAVNLITQDSGSIMSVNGPPGTGKTTLLRDIISDVIVKRADAMCEFDSPLNAFEATGVNVSTGKKGFWHVYKLSSKIKGHEILVASSNNAAVENISHELPDIGAIAREDASYFRTVSDALAIAIHDDSEDENNNGKSCKTWGLIAAALGNAKNRAKFQKAFWWHEEASMRLYLKAAKGDRVTIEETDPDTGEVTYRTPAVVVNEGVPENPDEALENWKTAKEKFKNLYREVESNLQDTEILRKLCRSHKTERVDFEKSVEHLLNAGHKFSTVMPPEHHFNFLWPDVQADFEQKIDDLMQNQRAHPSWHQIILPLQKGRAWRNLQSAYRLYCAQRIKTKILLREIDKMGDACAEKVIDRAFFEKTHQEKQTTTPWLNDSLHKKREDLFLSALDVHKAFIDVSAQRILHNVSVLFSSGALSAPDKKALMADLWSTLFLLVPVISTAFASVNRMLGVLPPKSLGWLLIDEAGQAVPQAAVGAIMRAKRSVIVGDPIQIEPVVTLPEKLVAQVFAHFNVDPDVWAAPKASAQTLADRTSTYQSAFETDTGERLVGIPLLVHRRCEDPMFLISNEVAYSNFMVSQVRPTDGGPIRAALGPSAWFPVDGDAETKWCPAEGEVVIRLFQKLKEQGVQNPDIFIITPFRIVAQEMRNRLRRESALLTSLGLDADNFAKKCVGTVHTVQGREADTVIMLLGAPKASQEGARRWAGSPENLLNVAVSRAKRNLYVIGSRGAWSGAGSFSVLEKRLPCRDGSI